MKLFTLTTAFIFFVSTAISQNLIIGNSVWWDYNDNGKKDSFEPGMAWVTVTLYLDNNKDGVADVGFTPITSTTNGSGEYSFNGLSAGKYFVTVDAGGSHYVSTRNGGDPDNDIDGDNNGNTQNLSTFVINSQTISVDPGTEPASTGGGVNNYNNTLDIGSWKGNGLGDHVWLDNNANGLQDVGEPGLANVTVTLKNTAGATYATTVTDANDDYYCYDPMVYGFTDYTLEFIQPAGYKPTHSNNGSDDEKDSDLLGGLITGVNVPLGKWDHSFDAGFVPNAVVLPIKLVSFSAFLNNKSVDLKWITTSEVNLNHFAIQVSQNGLDFNDAGLVFTVGNTTSEIEYNFSDEISKYSSSVVYYRLRTVDYDGMSQYSQIRMIRIAKQTENSISINTFPNPATNELRITVPTAWQNKTVVYEVIALSGQSVFKTATAAASQTTSINVSNLMSGIYTIRVTSNGQMGSQKIVKK